MKTALSRLSDNASYKIVALVVAAVLWTTMQGRRDTVLSRDMDVLVLLPPGYAITNPIPTQVRVEVVGPRVALKKLAERKEPFTIDLGQTKAGRHMLRFTKDGLNLPLGAKLVSIQPQEFLAVIVESEGNEKGQSDVKK